MRILLIAALLPLAACQSNWEREGQTANSSGTGATRTYDATGFTEVDLRGSDDVDVRIGSAFAIRAEGDSRILDRLDIRVVDGTLRIGRKDESGWNWRNTGSVRIHVTMPRLTGASVAGSGDLTVERADGDFEGDVAGSGNLVVTLLNGGEAELSIAGSGNIRIAGTATELEGDIAGSGDIDASALRATSAELSIAGSGDIRGTVAGDAKVSIVGSGDVELTGGARCQTSRMGSGDARCS